MKTIVRFVVLAFVMVATPTMAQNLPSGDARNAYFTQHFQRIVALNGDVTDYMKMPIGTVYRLPDGNTDELGAGDTKGIWGREFQKFYGYSYEKFLQGLNPPPTTPLLCPDGQVGIPPNCVKPVTEIKVHEVEKTPWWVWLLFALLVLLLWFLYLGGNTKEQLRERNQELENDLEEAVTQRELNRNPATAGPAMVPGGVTDETAPAAIQQVALRAYNQETGRMAVSARIFEIVELTPGRGWGVMNVSYNGVPSADRRLNNDRVYRAEVLFPDGNIETLYMLEGCGNDLRFSGAEYAVEDTFRFEPDETTTPEPVAAPVAVTTQATGVTPSARSASNRVLAVPEDGTVRLIVKNAGAHGPALVQIAGLTLANEPSVVIGENSFEFRYTPNK